MIKKFSKHTPDTHTHQRGRNGIGRISSESDVLSMDLKRKKKRNGSSKMAAPLSPKREQTCQEKWKILNINLQSNSQIWRRSKSHLRKNISHMPSSNKKLLVPMAHSVKRTHKQMKVR